MIRFARVFLISAVLATVSFSGSHAQDSPAAQSALGHASIQIDALDYAFRVPDEIPSGWVTISFTNHGDEQHFLYIAELPEGKTADDYVVDLTMNLDVAWSAVRDHGMDPDVARRLISSFEWWSPALDQGGAGITAPGRTNELTLYLEPGRYVLDCYLKTEEGEFHTMEGMVHELVVTENVAAVAPPEPDVEVALFNNRMEVSGDLTPGRRTVSVTMAEGRGQTVHVARMRPGDEVQEVDDWMRWLEPGGLMAPGPVEFVGGVHRMPEGGTAYFVIDLEPGRYLFVSQYGAHRGVLQEVTVDP